MMGIDITGNESIDNATATIALALGRAYPGWLDQEAYNAAMNLRNDIMAGTRELDAPLPPLDNFKVSNGGALPGLVARALRLNGQAPGHYHDPSGKYDYCTTDHSFDGPVM
jgi:hypothetical protein